jgi:catechol 2,3-dioxygenase-like lactoylglutathione lyase family enzyme
MWLGRGAAATVYDGRSSPPRLVARRPGLRARRLHPGWARKPMKQTPIVNLDHITVNVRDLKRARRFYEAALGALGMKVNLEFPSAFGMGSKDEKIFWLARDRSAAGGGHYAFRVDQPAEVDAFYDAALDAGGTDHGAPGPRPDYGPSYYAAFVKDPEDNNIEVVSYARARKATRKPTRKPAARARAAGRKRAA